MNLKPHFVGQCTDAGTLVYVAFDIEGHLGRDNRRYLIDTAR
jgi:hypothetical protein